MIARDGWGADYPHANNQLGLFVCGGGNNDVQYCNPDFDALMAQAAAEPDQDKQVALYNQAQTILMNDAAFLPLRFGLSTYEVKPYVVGPDDHRVGLAAAGRHVLRDHPDPGALVAPGDQYPGGPASRPAHRHHLSI